MASGRAFEMKGAGRQTLAHMAPTIHLLHIRTPSKLATQRRRSPGLRMGRSSSLLPNTCLHLPCTVPPCPSFIQSPMLHM
jgi:hypothetical protein